MRRSRKIALVALLLLVGVVLTSLSIHNNVPEIATEANIVTEARAVRKSNRMAIIDISDIVRKFVKPGTSREVVQSYLLQQGFELFSQKNKADAQEILIAVKAPSNESHINILGFYDEVKLVVAFTRDGVETVRGEIIYRAP